MQHPLNYLLLCFAMAICLPLHSQNHLESPAYYGIWRSVTIPGNEVFYFVIKGQSDYEGGGGYVITKDREATFSWTFRDRVFYMKEFDANYRSHEYASSVTYFDGNNWSYTVGNQAYKATRISKPLTEISNNRLRVGVYSYVQGFEQWCLYDKNGVRPTDFTKTAWFRLAKSVRNDRPGVISYGDHSEWYGSEGSTYFYVEGRYVSGNIQFTGYYHSYYYSLYPENYSKGSVLDWNLAFEGPCKWYHPNGNLQLEGRFKQGVLYGPLRTYNQNGQLIKTEQGKPLSEYEYYVEDNIIGSRE